MEGFEDIRPLPIVTGLTDELCQIMYTDEYKEVLGIARALIQKREYSERALELTSRVIDLAPAFYTVWNYRFDIVLYLSKSSSSPKEVLNEELDRVDEITLNNPKNYQIWSYKQSLLKNHPCPSFKRELPILQLMINDDTKNYHVWSFRKWCVLFFQDFSHELQHAGLLIERDVYNNSAWTHRMFVFKNTTPTMEEITEEIAFVKEKIDFVPQNVSVWAYLRGIYENFLNNEYDDDILEYARKFTKNVTESLHNEKELPDVESSFAIEFLAHVYSMNEATWDKAIRAYKVLSLKYDPIRKYFWEQQLSKLLK